MNDTPSMHFGLGEDAWKAVVMAESRQSIGFMQNGTVEADRETALNALRGDCGVPNLPGRSAVNDTAIAEAIDTIMPDLLEVFTGGEDVAAFDPVGPEDEALAQQETRTVVHIVMEQNPGVELIHDYCHDALSLKTGVFKVTWEEIEDLTRRDLPGVTPDQVELMHAQGVEVTTDAEGNAQFVERAVRGRPVIEVVAPEDFGVAPDTTDLRDAVYCVMRSRPRAQKLVQAGLDPAKIKRLSASTAEDSVSDARDTVENDEDASMNAAIDGLRQVEVHEHYIRFDPEGGDNVRLFQVLTDYACQVLLSVEEVDVIPFAAGTPFRLPHRFYGGSLADKLLEVQRIKTTLLRMMLDDGYFGVNNRIEVDMTRVNEYTLTDLLDNRPGRPVRSKGDALKPILSRGLSYDTTGAIEMVDVMGERRSGVVRNAQGLNPDALHDTAKGAQMLVSAAQKRVRLIARMLAQGIKDMYLLVHRLTRTNGQAITMRLGEGKFVQVEPSEWEARADASIRIAVGSGGRDEKLAMLTQVVERQAEAINMQGGVSGPIVNAGNVHSALRDLMKAAGLPEDAYFMDPETYEAPPPQPDVEAQRAQAEIALKERELSHKMAMQGAEFAHKREIETMRLQHEREIAEMKMRMEAVTGRAQKQDRPGGSLAA